MAAYLGIGGYAVGILAFEGIGSGFIQWPVALAVSALFALVIGALSLRTPRRLFHHDHARLCADGLLRRLGPVALRWRRRPHHLQAQHLRRPESISPIGVQFYYLCLACMLGGVYLIWRVVNSRFGLVVQGVRSNEQRMQAIGFHANRYRLVLLRHFRHHLRPCGALLANNTDFISPATMYWTRSGDLMVMVILAAWVAVRLSSAPSSSCCWKSSCRSSP